VSLCNARTLIDDNSLPSAGAALTVHKDNAKHEKWDRLKESNPVLRTFFNLRQQYDESENPIVSSMRSVTSTIGSWFDENETAQVMRISRYMDPTFSMDTFPRELREYIVPEVVDAYLSADKEGLQHWCGEAVRISFLISFCLFKYYFQTYNLLWATMEQYLKQGLISESRVLDIRHVDVRPAYQSIDIVH
jgi:mitochondrial import inner membrane translocase subunit TIM44